MPPWLRLTAIAAFIAAAGGLFLLYPLFFPGIFVVNSLMPTSGVVGTDIAIAGAGFDPANPVTLNQTVVPSRFVGPGEIHIQIPQVAPGQYTISVNGAGSLPLTVVAGSLTVSPTPFAAAIGQTSPLTVTLPAAAPPGGVSLNLVATPALVRIASPLLQVAAGNLSLGVDITGVAPGSGTLQVSGTGFTTSTLPFTSALPPSFSLASNQQAATVVWGAPAAYQITAQGSGGFAGQINLSATGAPSGSITSFSPSSIMAGQSSALTIATTLSGTQLGSFPIIIRGTSGGLNAQTTVTLNVARVTGQFTEATPLSSNKVCGNVTAFYDTSMFTVDFQVRLPAGPVHTSPPPQAAYYALSPQCRVGLVTPGLSNNPQPLVEVYNLGFPPATRPVTGIPGQAGTNLQNWLWRRFYFSPDDSLMYSIARLSGPAGTPGPHVGDLRNVITGVSHQCGFQFTPKLSTDRANEDSTDFLPNITSVTLNPGGSVTVVFVPQNPQDPPSFSCVAP